MNKLKASILIILIICVLLGTLFMLLKKSENNEFDNSIQDLTEQELIKNANEDNNIKNASEYFNVQTALEIYITSYDDIIEKNNELEARKQLKAILPEFVVNEMNISEQNIEKILSLPEGILRINNLQVYYKTVNKIAFEEETDMRMYIVDFDMINSEKLIKEKIKMIVLLDNINGTFYIIPREYIKDKNINLKDANDLKLYEKQEIEKNDYNYIDYNEADSLTVCQEYFNKYKLNVLYDQETAYNSLNKEYREKRFGNIEKYKNFIKNNDIRTAKLWKYKVFENENKNIYVCLDQYQRYYIFNEENLMQYNLILDTYTINLPQFVERYKNATNENKVAMNTEKIKEAINLKDYEYVYKKLDETFRNNNFKTIDNFEQYIKNNLFEINKFDYIDIKQEGQVYILKFNILDNTEKSKIVKQSSLIMKLLEGIDFVMSFSKESTKE